MICPFCGYDNKDDNETCFFCKKNMFAPLPQKRVTEVINEEKPRESYKADYSYQNERNNHVNEAKTDIKRNTLGYVNLKTKWFHHLLYACGAYVLMYILYIIICRVTFSIYRNMGYDFSGISSGTASAEVTAIYTNVSSVAQAVAQLACVALTAFIFRKNLKTFFNEFKSLNTYKWYGIGFVILYGLSLLYSFLLIIFKVQSDTNANQASVIQVIRSNFFFGFLFVVIAAPLFEELIFRFGIFRMFVNSNDKKKAKRWEIAGLVCTTLLFALVHMIATFEEMAMDPSNAISLLKNDLVSLPSYLIGAFALTFTYYKSKNLAASMMVHMTWNTISLISIMASSAAAIIFTLI